MSFNCFQVDDESGRRINLALNRHFQGVIVAVTIKVGALAEDAPVLFLRPLRIVVIVRRRKLTLAR